MLVLRRFQRAPTVFVLEQTIKNNNVYPSTPQFIYIKVGRKVVYISHGLAILMNGSLCTKILRKVLFLLYGNDKSARN